MRRLVHNVHEVHDVLEVHDKLEVHDETQLHITRQLRELRPGLKADKCQYATCRDPQNSPTISLPPQAQRRRRKMAAEDSKSKSKPSKREDLDARLKEAFGCNDWNWPQQHQQLRVGCKNSFFIETRTKVAGLD